MATNLYTLHALTHLHAGSGSTNYGVIDNLVQRDPVSEMPCIYASSLKGAFREYFKEGSKKLITAPLIADIFGDENTNGTFKKASHVFHEAKLLTIPVRSSNKPFYNATAPFILKEFVAIAKLLGITSSTLTETETLANADYGSKPKIMHMPANNILIEDFEIFDFIPGNANYTNEAKKILGNDLVIFPDEDFKYLCSDYNLPIIARNNLENGQSKNLWYEQIIPRESNFYFFTTSLNGNASFATNINNSIVQIGANASIGYGQCIIKKIA